MAAAPASVRTMAYPHPPRGVIDQRFLDQVPDAAATVGQRLIIRRTEAETVLDDLEAFVAALAAVEPPSPPP